MIYEEKEGFSIEKINRKEGVYNFLNVLVDILGYEIIIILEIIYILDRKVVYVFLVVLKIEIDVVDLNEI